jgi:hypothetical protein
MEQVYTYINSVSYLQISYVLVGLHPSCSWCVLSEVSWVTVVTASHILAFLCVMTSLFSELSDLHNIPK